MKKKELAKIIETYNESFISARRYLNSDKFATDVMVNKNDILMRLDELNLKLIDQGSGTV